jgi:NitT/TauT family transport system permease protein
MNSPTWRNTLVTKVIPPLIPLILGSLIAEIAVRWGWVRAYIVPPPSKIAQTLFTAPDLALALGQTAIASIGGFLLSAVVGLVLAVALSSSKWIQRTFYPYAVLFQTVPIIAIAPMLVIWIGFGLSTVATSAFIVSVFPVIANTLTGLLSTDPALIDLFRLYRAKPQAALVKLRLPYALPNILTGLRIAAGLSVIGAIVGEFITGGGLGGIIDASRTQQRIDKVFAVLILASGLGIALFGCVNLASRLLLRNWHASERPG